MKCCGTVIRSNRHQEPLSLALFLSCELPSLLELVEAVGCQGHQATALAM